MGTTQRNLHDPRTDLLLRVRPRPSSSVRTVCHLLLFPDATYRRGLYRGLKASHFRELHVLREMACNAEMIRLQCQGVYCHQVPGVETAIFSERGLCGEAAYVMYV